MAHAQLAPRAQLLRVTRQRRCPECDHGDWCMVAADGSGALCMRKPGGKLSRNGGWWYSYHARGTPVMSQRAAPSALRPQALSVERASAAECHATYTALLQLLTLSTQHRGALIGRGLADAEIAARGYVSTPDARRIADLVAQLSTFNLLGVPGFYCDDGRWKLVTCRAGYFVPYRDERGRIVGLQYRLEQPLNEGKTKCLWLSSAGRPRGVSSGAPVHCARAHLLPVAREVTLTEGALKADVCAYYLNAPVIAAAGVTNFGQDFAARLRASYPQLTDAIIAFDADLWQKPQVYAALERLAAQLEVARVRVRVRTWPVQFKGFDDYLMAQTKREEAA